MIIRFGRLTEIKWSVCITKSQSFCVLFFRTDSGLWIYHLFIWSNFSFRHNSQWITLPTQSWPPMQKLHNIYFYIWLTILNVETPYKGCQLYISYCSCFPAASILWRKGKVKFDWSLEDESILIDLHVEPKVLTTSYVTFPERSRMHPWIHFSLPLR